jgi:leucyl aminopeptidase
MQSSIDKALAVVNGMALARTLGDMPSNICTPTYLAQTAQALAKEFGLGDCLSDDINKIIRFNFRDKHR